LEGLSKETTNKQVDKSIDEQSSATTDGANNCNDLNETLVNHDAVVVEIISETGKVLPWVHIAISNAKRFLLDIHYSIGSDYLHSYLDEFCYKFNRRYFDSVFQKVIIAAVSCTWENKL